MKYGLAILLVFVAGTAWAVSDYVVPHTWRYKITVEIETPEGIKTGSAVREVRAWKNITEFINPDVRGVIYRVKGEAVVVDLGERGVLFGLLSSNSNNEVEKSFSTSFKNEWDRAKYYDSLGDGKKAILPREYWPRMVMFEDISDPASVMRVLSEGEPTVFGADIAVKNIIIEITSDPVTWSVKNILHWLPMYYDKRLDGRQIGSINASNRTANSLSSGAFSTGRK